MSPDGRYIAIALTDKGKRQLWLQPLDSLESQAMPNTEDAAYPFWSPDSRWIGFFAEQKLRKIAVAGGPSQSLADAGGGFGGTWSRDDVILFAPVFGSTMLRRVSAAGGTASDVLTTLGFCGFPEFLQDGRHFYYYVAASSDKGGVYLASLEGKENRRVIGDPSNVAIALSKPGNTAGHILFLRENNLVAQPVEAGTGQIVGDAVPIAEGISRIPTWVPVSASDNGVMVYWNRGGISGLNQIVSYDRTGKVLEKVSAPGDVWEPSISPDGKTIAFARFKGGNSDIWLRNEHNVDQRFTTDASRNDTPVWSPSGDRIAFRSTRTGQQQIWLKAVNGAGKEELLQTDANTKFASQWTRDGKSIVYSDNSGGATRIDIWFLPLEGDRKPVKFLQTEFNEAQGQISPDGHWMAYMSERTGHREVYVAQFPSAEGESRISTDGGEQPRWRGDGKELFYVAADAKMMSVPIQLSTGPKPSFDHGSPVALFDSAIAVAPDTRAFQYDVTADGRRFIVATGTSSASGSSQTPPLTVLVNWAAGLKK